MIANSNISHSVCLSSEDSPSAAYARLQSARVALPIAGLVSVNLDITSAVATALSASTRVLGLRDRFLRLEEPYLKDLDQLQECALALDYAHRRYLVLGKPQDGLVELNSEGNETRRRLCSVLTVLVQSKIINPESLSRYTGRTGYQKVVNDLLLTVEVFRANWAAVEGKSPVTKEQVDRAEQVATQMQQLVGARRVKRPTATTEAADQRRRAFNLLLRCYESVRRAVQFLRWEEADADKWIPSLYAQSGPKAAKKTRVESAPEARSSLMGNRQDPKTPRGLELVRRSEELGPQEAESLLGREEDEVAGASSASYPRVLALGKKSTGVSRLLVTLLCPPPMHSQSNATIALITK